MRSIFSNLSRTKSIFNDNFNPSEKQLNLLVRAEDYIMGGSYSNYSKKEPFLSFMHHTDFVLSKKLGVTEEAVRKIRSRLSSEAYHFLGTNFFDLLIKGDDKSLEKVELVLNVSSSKFISSYMFPADVLLKIREVKFSESVFDIEDCVPELVLLHWLRIKRIEDAIASVDGDRLVYLLDLIDGKILNFGDRTNVLRVINSDDLSNENLGVSKSKLRFPPVREEVVSIEIADDDLFDNVDETI